MKYSFVSAGIIAFGLIGLTLLFLFGALTINNEQDYYNLKEVTEAAMIESIDIAYYRDTGELKMSQEKFTENFTRRFSESTQAGVSNYEIVFQDIVERPPKVSVVIITSTGQYTLYGDTQSFDIANKIDAILAYSPNEESNSLGTSNSETKKWVKKEMRVKIYSFPYASSVRTGRPEDITNRTDIKDFIPDELNECIHSDIRNVRFDRVENPKKMETQAEMNHYEEIAKDTYYYDWEGLENTASSKVSYIMYQAETIDITPDDFEYEHTINDIDTGDDDVYTCEAKDANSKNIITWKAVYTCSFDLLAYNKAQNGAVELNMCGVGITYDIIFTYEQYE